ncbi:MAG TPA: SDR family oxidoreductase [Acidimicrobiia bacterium]|nr:SDR family oxidoreductase [Acidimicrobiia bacterium]
MGTLDGYAALVTGGGSGIGFGCAQVLLADGADVTICGRTESRLNEAAATLEKTAAESGGHVAAVVADVTDEEQVVAAIAKASERSDGRLHALVNSAGGSRTMGPLHMADTATVRETLELNAMGTFLTIKHSAPRMAAAGGGSYVAISSHAGRDTFRFLGAYGAAKAAMDFFVRVAADELGASRIRFNSVLPGGIATEIMEGITAGGPVLDSYHAQTPLWRFGTVDDVSALVRFLVGPESAWISGQLFSVDGGQSVRGSADYSAFAKMAFGHEPLWQLLEEPPHDPGEV